jgi:release factor glutamine methyltransferase
VTLGEALRASADKLERAGVDSPRLDAELLSSKALGLSRLELYAQHERRLVDAEAAAILELVERRRRREPLAYVLGEWGFRRLTLKTDARALVPRPETEIVVERALTLIANIRSPRVLDVGTGSGAIALAIASERPDASVHATDSSGSSLALARENANRLGLEVEFSQANLVDDVAGRYDLVVSNPPYVLADEQLPPELAYEPREAWLDEGQTERLATDARRILDGWLVLEVHEERAQAAAHALGDRGYADVTITRDLAGKERVLDGRWTQ